MAVAKEQIRQIISENNISSVADVYTLLKDSFKDILQKLMEAEFDTTLSYKKIIREIIFAPKKNFPRFFITTTGANNAVKVTSIHVFPVKILYD